MTPRRFVLVFASFLVCLILSFWTVPGLADDSWPQILGPNRSGSMDGSATWGTEWPAQIAPKWDSPLGSGLAGAAVMDSKVLVTHRVKDKELLRAIELDTGKQIWETSWQASYRASINPDNGPRCVPATTIENVVCYGAAGDLVCMRLSDGELRWQRKLRAEYDADDGYFGAGSSPLILGDLVIVCLGGKKAGVVAVDIETGKTRWTATNYDASYAAPIVVPQPSGNLLLVVTRLNTVLLAAQTGEVLSDVKFGSRGPTVNAATPLRVAENEYLLTASYGVGATLLKLEAGRLVEKFRGSELLSSQYVTPVLVGNHVIGVNGREDVGSASLRSVDVTNQRVIWEKTGFGIAHLISNESQVLAVSLDGELTLLDGTAKQYSRLATMRLPPGTYRSLPALAGNKLIVRASQSDNSSKLFCIELP